MDEHKIVDEFSGNNKSKQTSNSQNTRSLLSSDYRDPAASSKSFTRISRNYRIVWLNMSIDDINNDIYPNITTKLREIIDDVKIFQDVHEYIHFITDINKEPIFLIISGIVSDIVILTLQDVLHVKGIYILGEEIAGYEQWIQQKSKVRGIYTDIISICEALKQAVKGCEQNMVSINITKTTDQTSNPNLNRLNQSFMYTQILKEILLTIDFEQKHFDEFITYCRQQFIDNASTLAQIDEIAREYWAHTPIWWYTRDYFLYSMLNKALRLMKVDVIIKMGFFICDLYRHITELHSEQYAKSNYTNSLTVYRGQGISRADFDNLMETQSGLLSFNSFLSTSFDRDVSFAYADSNRYDPNLVGILFEITIDPKIPSASYANICGFSAYQQENEILFSMHSVFRIETIEQIGSDDRLWQVKLTITNDNDAELNLLTQNIREDTKQSTGWLSLANLLRKLAYFQDAENLQQDLLTQTADEDEKSYLHHMLGTLRHDQGDYTEAFKFYEKALEIKEKVLPSNHPDLATSYNNIGHVYDSMGEYSKALSSQEKALEIKEKVLPSNHPDLATSYNNIGQVYDSMGEYSKALSFFEKALAIKEKALPPNHPDLATSYNNIGNVYGTMGEYSKALSFYEKALAIDEKALPPNHPDLAISYNHIGNVYGTMGEYSKALSFYEKALPPNHPDLATSYNNIGLVYNKMGEYSKALSFYEKALAIEEKALPPNHPDLATSHNNIGLVYKKMGEYSKALSFYEKALAIEEKALPPNHLDLATSHNNIGLVYNKMGEYSKALSFYEKALAIDEKALPPNHPDLATSYNNIGFVYKKMGEYSKALSFYEKALAIDEKALPPNHPDLATSYNNIGFVYKKMGEYSKALSFYEKALAIDEKALPANHPDLATSYNNIGNVYGSIGEYSKALSSHEKALEIKEKALPANHPDLATSYNNIGNVYDTMGEYSKALSFYEKALAIDEKALPPNHPAIATSYNNIGNVYDTMGEYSKALSFYEKALAIDDKALPPNHPDLAT